MKIGLLTLPFNNNYGGLLQCYALQTFLKEQGHEVYVIKHNFSRKGNLKSKIYSIIKRLLRKDLKYKIQTTAMQQFENTYLRETHLISSTQALHSLKKYNFDVLIVGSDQVWRFEYTKDNFAEYFLNFAKEWHIKRFAFAASFGIDSWTINCKETQELKHLIKLFNKVSVREISGIKLCKEYLNSEAIQLLDPTFLTLAENYRSLYSHSNSNSKTLAIYLLDISQEKIDAVNNISHQMNLSPTFIGKNPNNGIYQKVEDWLKGIDTSSLVITDSFHGVVFSIIFNKPFILLMNENRGATRFSSLFQTFNFNKVYSCSMPFSTDYINLIDRNLYKQIIENNKKLSIDFLL